MKRRLRIFRWGCRSSIVGIVYGSDSGKKGKGNVGGVVVGVQRNSMVDFWKLEDGYVEGLPLMEVEKRRGKRKLGRTGRIYCGWPNFLCFK